MFGSAFNTLRWALVVSSVRFNKALRLAGLSKKSLANAVGVSAMTVNRWSKAGVPEARLAAAAQALGVMPEFLIEEDTEPLVEQDRCNFRSLTRTTAADRKRALGFCDLIALLLELVDERAPGALPRPDSELLGRQPPEGHREFKSAAPEKEGLRLRRVWGLGTAPIPNVVELLESRGVVVVTVPSFAAATIDAWSFWAQGRPVVVLNHQKADPRRTRFDALHELGHFALGHSGAETEADGRPRRGRNRELEQQADEFAGTMLIDTGTWARMCPRSGNPRVYLRHRAHWGASAGALIYRAAVAGVLNERTTRSAWVRYSALGWRGGEPAEPGETYEQPALLRAALRTAGLTLRDAAVELGLHPEGQAGRMLVELEQEGWETVIRLQDVREVQRAKRLPAGSVPDARVDRLFGLPEET